jgi:hypothetical protein
MIHMEKLQYVKSVLCNKSAHGIEAGFYFIIRDIPTK